jgi:predicted N-acyltransferase
MSVQVVTGVAAQWADHVGDDVPIHASRPWVGATAHRLGHRLTFLGDAGGQRGGLMGVLVEAPAGDEMINLYGTLLTDPKMWKFPATNLEGRAGLRAQLPPPADWVPHLTVMYPGFDTFVAADGGPSAELAAGLADGVVKWAAGHGLKAVTFGYVREDTILPQVLAERGFRRVPLTYRSRMPVPATFEDYLATLSVNGRSQANRERRRLAEAGVQTKLCAFEDVWPDMLALRRYLVERYGQQADEAAETANLRGLLDNFGEDQIRLYCSFLDGRIVGFSLFVIWRGTWYGAYTGTYVEPQTRSVYFDHFIYAPLIGAIAEGARVVDLGIGAFEGKRRRGAVLTAVDMWVRVLDPAIEHGVEVAAAAMLREEGWVQAG